MTTVDFGASMTQYYRYGKFERVLLTVAAHQAHQLDLSGLERTFLECDKDRSGGLTKQEMRAAFRDRLNVEFSDEEFDSMFDAWDSDGTGKITYTE